MSRATDDEDSGTARAARVTSAGVIEIDTLELSTRPGPGEVEIAVIACGICGSNLHHLNDPDVFTEDRRHTPGALGHEASGRIVSVGDGVTTHQPGDLVVLEPQLAASCGKCDGCATGRYWFCEQPAPLRVWGFSDRIVVRAAGAWRLDPEMDPEVATLMEAMGVSVHAIRSTALCERLDDDLTGVRVAVLGAGATGLLAVAAARALGASEVASLARHPHQVDLAKRLGATTVIQEGDDSEAELTAFSPNLILECVGGRADTINVAIRVAAPRAEISVLGLFDGERPINLRAATRKELHVTFSIVYGEVRGRHDFAIGSEILAAHQDTFSALLTHRFAFDDIADAFTQAGAKGEGVVRVLVTNRP